MELFTAIRDALITRLRKLPWMNEETQNMAQDKVRSGILAGMGACAGNGVLDQARWGLETSAKGPLGTSEVGKPPGCIHTLATM